MKKNYVKQFLKCALVVVGALSMGIGASAQTAASYSFAASSGTYSAVSASATATSLTATIDDGISSTFTFPSGFTFTFAGVTYTDAKVASNGYLVFGSAGSSTATNDLATTTTTLRPLLAPLWDDLQCSSGVKYELSGSGTSRVLTIEWKGMEWNYTSGTAVVSFQIKLYETSNIIQFVYKQDATAYTPGSTGGASIGIKGGGSSTDYISLASSGTTPTTSTSTSTNNIASKPADGQIYQFTPPPPTCTTPAPGATIATPSTLSCLGNSTILSITTAPTGTGNSFQWQSSPDNSTYTDIGGASSSTYTATPAAATWYKCKVTCANGPVTVSSTAVQVIFATNIVSTTNGVRCGTGTASLAATGPSGSTLRWYAAASGGASLGSGSPFTTPIISATTNYYVGAETNSSGSGVVGSGTSSANSTTAITPFSLFYTSAHTQYLVLASDLDAAGFAAGNLTSLSFNVTTKSSTKSYSNYTIRLAHSTATGLSGFLTPTLTTVYGPATYNSVTGANNFSFGTSFSWNGTSNILVDVCFDNVTPGTGFSSNDAVSFVPKSYTATYGMYSDPTVMCGATTGGSTASANAIPVMTFIGNKVCSSPRVAVIATVNTPPAFSIAGSKTLCNNGVDSMSVTSAISNFTSYVWTPATGLFTDAGCTSAYVPGASTNKVYTKSATAATTKYFCNANNSSTLCAAVDSAIITVLPSSVTAIATPNSICVSGNTKLALNPSTGYGSASFQWQSSSDNSTFSDSTGMTGTTLTTTTLSKTRYYRAVVKNSAGTVCLNTTSDTALVYNPNVASSTGASRCGPGAVTLNATATDGTVNWFAASSGGSSLSSGTSYTTPSLSSTTTYYAEVRATPDISGTIGTAGTSLSGSGTTPFGLFWESARTQYLITAAELTASGFTVGSFNTMAFDVTSKSSTAAFNGYTIKMANTTTTALSGYLTPTFTTVYGPSNYTTSTGLNVFSLSGGFNWDGTSNVLIEICFSNSGLGYSGNDVVKATTKSFTGTYGSYNDGVNLCSSIGSTASTTVVPDITFTRQGCVSSRTAVVATINTVPTPTISPATGPVQICAGNTTTFTGGGGGTYQWKDLSGNILGATSSTYTTGTGGSYRVVVTTPATGCKDSSVFVAVNVNPVPTVSIAPVGTTKICADSAQKYTSVVTGSGLTYQWFNTGVAITGATTDKLTTPTAGIYTLRVYLGTCSDTSNEATLIINPLPASSFTKTGPTGAICLGGTLELTALIVPATSSYQWMLNGVDIPGATSKIFNAAVGGIYTVRIKDSNSCRKISDTMTIINTPMGVPNLLPKDVRFCEGTDIILYSNAGPYSSTFKWTKDGGALPDSTPNIVTGLAGTYDVTVKDVYGCVLTSPKVVITVDPLPVKPVIVKTGTVLTTAAPYTTYQWYRNGKIIAGATKRSYTLMFDGKYHVLVTNNANCNNVSDTLSIQNLSVKSIVRNDIEVSLYPNPSQSIVNIDAPVPVNLYVKDLQGKQILELKDAKQVDMGVYADGIYIFTITDKEGMVIKMDKVVKRTN